MLSFDRDNRIVFNEEEHKYYVDGNQMDTSVTTLVHQYFSHFDKEGTAKKMLKGRNFWSDEKYSCYWELVKDLDEEDAVAAIVNKWDTDGKEAALLGTQMHASIESYYMNNTPLADTKECKMFKEFDKYVTEQGYVPAKSEQIVWDLDYSLAGSVDMLYKNTKSDSYWLADWKRSKEIKYFGFGGAKGTGPMSNKHDCNYEHYSLQLNIYKFLLEKNYGITIERMSLVILHPNNNKYMLLEVKDNQKAVKLIMEERAKLFMKA